MLIILSQKKDSKTLWRDVKSLIREVKSEEGLLIFDNTLETKPHTDENEVVFRHFDHTQSKSVKGMNLLSALVRYGDIALSVTFEMIRKDQKYEDPKTGERKRRSLQIKNEMFREMIQTGVRNQVKFH